MSEKKRGRPEGTTNRYSREAIEKARESGDGLLPHEILLDMARGNPQREIHLDPQTGARVIKYVPLDVEQRKDAAKAAAPYFAPKISTVEVIKNANDAELDRIIAELAAQTGLIAGDGGEAGEDEAEDRGAGSPATRTRVRLLDD